MGDTPKQYQVNEIFVAPQGEGLRVGTLNAFVRFSGCNLQCDIEPGPLSPGGFACDSEFSSGRKRTAAETLAFAQELNPRCKSVIFTGGEPGLQLDAAMVDTFKQAGYHTAIETNGTIDVTPLGLDWITCSPKVAEHAIKLPRCNEVKYVRCYGHGIPRPSIKADHYLISPGFDANELNRRNLDWCLKLLHENPTWRLSVQLHKSWQVR
jgi:7-carboxy-7-deazaguanine synthase